jgi:DNA-binding CsgD family transcriptional regulator
VAVDLTLRIATGRLLRSLCELDFVETAFAARVDSSTSAFVLDRFEGSRTEQLRDLVIPPTTGLGGRCIALRRPVSVRDYEGARGITHEFDRQVAAEGLRAIFAVPVLKERGVSEIVYGASRRPVVFPAETLVRASRLIARSAEGVRMTQGLAQDGLAGRLRSVWSDLHDIADDLTDPELRSRMLDVADRIPLARVDPGPPTVRLTRRETDVLAQVATGLGNRQIGVQLGLTEQTVKSYLRSAMTKLSSSTRGEAVYRARNAGLLP